MVLWHQFFDVEVIKQLILLVFQLAHHGGTLDHGDRLVILNKIRLFQQNRPNAAIDTWYNRSHTISMKTAISIPDKIYEAAEKAAKRLGVSRSEFYVNAIEEYLSKNSDENLTEELNKIYSNPESLSQSELDPALRHMQKQSIGHGEW